MYGEGVEGGRVVAAEGKHGNRSGELVDISGREVDRAECGVFEHEQIIVIVKADRQSDVGDERTGGNFDIQTWRGSYVVPCSQAIGYGNKGLTGGVGCDWSVGR